jgi:hypothetical protein
MDETVTAAHKKLNERAAALTEDQVRLAKAIVAAAEAEGPPGALSVGAVLVAIALNYQALQ